MVINNPLFELNLEEDQAREVDLQNFTKLIKKGTNSLNIFHMNVCSLRAKFNQLEILFNMMSEAFDCIILPRLISRRRLT